MILSKQFDRALVFALEKHRKQLRKGSSTPYMTHLMTVASLIGEHGGDEEQMIAGLLHDVIEDQGVSAHEIEEQFGARVAHYVEACTDSYTMPKPPWKERKVAYVNALREKPSDIKLVSICDKFHNASSILRDLKNPEIGEKIWSRFSAKKEETLWYYRALVNAYANNWSHLLIHELDEIVKRLEQ